MQLSRKATPLLGLATLAALGLAAHPAQAQDLTGQDVALNYLYPDTGSEYEYDGTQTVVPGGVTFTSFGQVYTKVTPTQVVVTTDPGYDGYFFASSTFNGPKVSEVGASPVNITGVTVDSATNFTGFDSSRVSFDAGDVFVNLQGLTLNSAQNITLDLGFGPATAAPEPSSVAAFAFTGLGAAGLMLKARKRRA